MSEAPDRLHAMSGAADDAGGHEFDFADYCARPMCRKEFRQSAGRGRRRDYCSETCRRLADRDYKRAKVATTATRDEVEVCRNAPHGGSDRLR